MSGKINNLLIPNVSKLPQHKNVDLSDKIDSKNKDEFKKLLNNQIGDIQERHGIKLSLHAAKRLQERNLEMDSEEYFKLKDAMNRLKDKGGRDSLVITGKAAYIVDVANSTVVTAVDKNNMGQNVFTKIDSTLVIN